LLEEFPSTFDGGVAKGALGGWAGSLGGGEGGGDGEGGGGGGSFGAAEGDRSSSVTSLGFSSVTSLGFSSVTSAMPVAPPISGGAGTLVEGIGFADHVRMVARVERMRGATSEAHGKVCVCACACACVCVYWSLCVVPLPRHMGRFICI
jgi:hypothetical protein